MNNVAVKTPHSCDSQIFQVPRIFEGDPREVSILLWKESKLPPEDYRTWMCTCSPAPKVMLACGRDREGLRYVWMALIASTRFGNGDLVRIDTLKEVDQVVDVYPHIPDRVLLAEYYMAGLRDELRSWFGVPSPSTGGSIGVTQDPLTKFIATAPSIDEIRAEAARCAEETARYERGERGPLRMPTGLLGGEFSDAAFGVAAEVAVVVKDAMVAAGQRRRFVPHLAWSTAATLLRNGWQRGHRLEAYVTRGAPS